MDIEINDQPLVELGDLIFIDDMMRGQVHQVIGINLDVFDSKTGNTHHHRFGLYSLKSHTLGRTFRNDAELNRFVAEHLGAITIRKQKDYIWSLRKK